MQLRKYRWSRDYESAEEELIQLFETRGILAERWHESSDVHLESRVHALDRKLWCAEGSIIITINGKPISLQPGDALEIPAYTIHSALTGISGCALYEAPLTTLNPAILQV